MITHVYLEEFLTKCEDALLQVREAQRDANEQLALAQENIRILEDQTVAVDAQVLTTKMFMDSYNNPSSSEIPFGGDKIEELFDKRLEGRDGESREDTRKDRQKVYLKESMDIIEEVDALNETTEEVLPGEDPEVSP